VLFSGSVAELSLTNHRRCRDTAPYLADLHIIPATDPVPGREAARAMLQQERASLDNSRRQKNGLSLARIAITMQATKPCQISPAPS
jgi:hypothetical protein